MILVRQPWTRQPPPSVGFDRRWLNRGLVALFDQRLGLERVQNVWASSNTATVVPSVRGVGGDYTGTANTQYPHRDAYATVGAMSIVALVDVDALTNYSAIIAKQENSTTRCPYELRLGNAPTDGKINLVRANATTFEVRTSASSIVSAGFSGVVGVSSPNGNLNPMTVNAYVGANKYSLSVDGGGAGSDVATDNGTSSVWIGRRSDGATQLDGKIYWVALFNRELLDAEWTALAANPWQLFEPRQIYIPTAEAATGPTVTALTPTTIGSTSHRPRYTWTPA
jgi:hypothetical protein